MQVTINLSTMSVLLCHILLTHVVVACGQFDAVPFFPNCVNTVYVFDYEIKISSFAHNKVVLINMKCMK